MKNNLEKIIGESMLFNYYFKSTQFIFLFLGLIYYILVFGSIYIMDSVWATFLLMIIFLTAIDVYALKTFYKVMQENHQDILILKNFDYSGQDILKTFSNYFFKKCLKLELPVLMIHLIIYIIVPPAYELKILLSMVLTILNTWIIYIKTKHRILKPIILKKDIFGR